MRVVIRHYIETDRYEWWVLSADGFPLGCGLAPDKRTAVLRGRAAADQYAAEALDIRSQPLT